MAGGVRTWYTGDALGSVRATVNDTGNLLGTANFDPWGRTQGFQVSPFGFTGELQQGGNVYLRAALVWHSGRWLMADGRWLMDDGRRTNAE